METLTDLYQDNLQTVDVGRLMTSCTLCPRECGANRLAGETGFCGETAEIRLARAALHFWEEPCISGTEGSGAVFFTGCNLQCVFCQNAPISRSEVGLGITSERLAEIFLELQAKGANNINLVTATHFVPQAAAAIDEARAKGLTVPIVYNSSSYEKAETLRLLDGRVQIYLPDFKYRGEEAAVQYSNAPGYKDTALAAVREMLRQVGGPAFDERGMMTKGVIIRILLLPGLLEDAKRIVKLLHREFGDSVYLSLMNQYTPMPDVPKALSRHVTEHEYEKLVDYALDLGVTKAFVQEGEAAQESFIPAFDYEGVAAASYASQDGKA